MLKSPLHFSQCNLILLIGILQTGHIAVLTSGVRNGRWITRYAIAIKTMTAYHIIPLRYGSMVFEIDELGSAVI